jgi:hypothetical protein
VRWREKKAAELLVVLAWCKGVQRHGNTAAAMELAVAMANAMGNARERAGESENK